MEKVKTFRSEQTQITLDFIKEIETEARKNSAIDFACVMVYDNGAVMTANSGGEDVLVMVGLLESLKQKMIEDFNSEDEIIE